MSLPNYGQMAISKSDSMPNIALHEPLMPTAELEDELDPMTRSHTMHFAQPPQEQPSGQFKRSQSFMEKLGDYGADSSVMWRLTGLEEDDDDDEVEMLPKKPPALHLQNNRKTFATIMKAMVGAAVLFLPDGYKQAGLLTACFLIFFSGLLSTYCMVLLMELSNHFREKGEESLSYGFIGRQAIGGFGARSVDVSIFLSQVGFCCAGLIFVEENMITVMKQLSSQASWTENKFLGEYIVLGCMPALMLLAWVRKLKKFSFTNIVADIFILAGLLVSLGYASYSISQNGVGPNVRWYVNAKPELFVFAGTSVYMFEGIALVIPIQEAMEKPDTMPQLMRFCMALITGFFLIFASVSYIAYGDNIKNIVILNMPTDTPVSPIIQIMYILAIYCTYPLTLFPSIRILETLIITKLLKTKGKWKKNFLRTSLVLATGVISCASIYTKFELSNFVSLIGSVCCVPLAFIYPALFHAMILKDKNPWYKQAFDYFIVILGVILMFATTVITVYVWYKGTPTV